MSLCHEQGHYAPMPPPMLPSPENLKGADLLRHRCMYGSKLMSSDEIENILRIQEKFLTSGVPYNEDYYYLVRHHCLPQGQLLRRQWAI